MLNVLCDTLLAIKSVPRSIEKTKSRAEPDVSWAVGDLIRWHLVLEPCVLPWASAIPKTSFL